MIKRGEKASPVPYISPLRLQMADVMAVEAHRGIGLVGWALAG